MRPRRQHEPLLLGEAEPRLSVKCPDGHSVGRVDFSTIYLTVTATPHKDNTLAVVVSGSKNPRLVWVCRACVRAGLRNGARPREMRLDRLVPIITRMCVAGPAHLRVELSAKGVIRAESALPPKFLFSDRKEDMWYDIQHMFAARLVSGEDLAVKRWPRLAGR